MTKHYAKGGGAYLCEILGKSKTTVTESKSNVARGRGHGKVGRDCTRAQGHLLGNRNVCAVAVWTAVRQAALVKAQSPVHLKLAYFIVCKFYLEKVDSPQN